MVRYIKLFSLLFILGACTEDTDVSAPEPIPAIVGLWQYDHIIVEDILVTPLADNKMEPGTFKGNLGGERAEINRRRVRYYEDGTYQLLWLDRGAYELGTDGDPNWQPSYGMYRCNAGEDSLFHNLPLHYQQAYALSFEADTLIRTSYRYMSSYSRNNNNGAATNLWREGDIVKYQEVFYRINE